jgi:hypothetical protein
MTTNDFATFAPSEATNSADPGSSIEQRQENFFALGSIMSADYQPEVTSNFKSRTQLPKNFARNNIIAESYITDHNDDEVPAKP